MKLQELGLWSPRSFKVLLFHPSVFQMLQGDRVPVGVNIFDLHSYPTQIGGALWQKLSQRQPGIYDNPFLKATESLAASPADNMILKLSKPKVVFPWISVTEPYCMERKGNHETWRPDGWGKLLTKCSLENKLNARIQWFTYLQLQHLSTQIGLQQILLSKWLHSNISFRPQLERKEECSLKSTKL